MRVISASISAESVELWSGSFFIGDGADSTRRAAWRRELASPFCFFQARFPQAHLRSAVELRLGEKSHRFAQDLVGPFQLTILALEFFEALSFRTSQPRAFALVALRLPNPFTQGLTCAADLSRDRVDRRPLRFVFSLVLKDHPNRSFPNFRRILLRSVHDSYPLKIWSLRETRGGSVAYSRVFSLRGEL